MDSLRFAHILASRINRLSTDLQCGQKLTPNDILNIAQLIALDQNSEILFDSLKERFTDIQACATKGITKRLTGC